MAELPITSESPGNLSRGLAGRALALAYLSRLENHRHLHLSASASLEGAIEDLGRNILDASLYSGITGIAWAANHLQKPFAERLEGSEHETDDESIAVCLLAFLEQQPWRRDYDLISGLVGIGLYAWDRLPKNGSEAILNQVLEHLKALARPMAQGVSWHTPPHLLPEWHRKRDPEGYFNLGVAHGVPAVINLLARMSAAGIQPEASRQLAREGYRWLISTRFPATSDHCFGTIVGADGYSNPTRGSRIAWCYGDLGVSVALLGAARFLQDPDMEGFALEVAHSAAQRTSKRPRANDATLCHGTSGNGHLFNRLFQATGKNAFLQAAHYWMEMTLDFRLPGKGIGGYQAWMRPETAEDPWVDEPGLLEGSAGIALALLSACEPIFPHWDRMLLTDIPEPLPTPWGLEKLPTNI